METIQENKENQTDQKAKSLVWDCGSSLYDSFELKSFERQLDSAISSRTLSMPHLSSHRTQKQPLPLPPPPPQQQTKPVSKMSSMFSRPFQKILRTIFGPKQTRSALFKAQGGTQDGFYFLYDGSGVLSTIPEVPESGGDYGGVSPEFNSLAVERSVSDRFKPTSIGISCA